MLAEDFGHGLELGAVARGGRGAVHVHVVDLVGGDSGLGDGVAHRLFGALAFGVGGREVVCVRRASAADDFAVDLGAAGLCVFVLLKDERTGSFADDESVAVLVERTRSVLRVVVAGREGLHRVEAADTGFIDRSLGTAGHHDGGFAPADVVERVDQAVVGRGAGRHGAVVGAHETVFHGDESRRDVRDHAGDEEWAKPRRHSSLGIAQTFVEERFQTTDTRAPDHARLLQVDLLQIERRVLHGLRGGDERILGEEVVLANLLAVEVLRGVVVLYLASELGFEFFGIEVRDGGGATDTLFEIGEILCDVIAERVDGTDARNDYSSLCHKFKLL